MKEILTLKSCPICASKKLRNDLRIKDHSISKETFQTQVCENCSFKFTNPRPTSKNLGTYYESEDYISHSDSATSLVNKIYKIARSYTLKQKVRIINKYKPGKGKLLDIGCGTGYFLSTAAHNGWCIAGTEPNETARSLSEDNSNSRIKETIYEHNDTFDVVTLWHVLEHLENLNQDLEKISSLLKHRAHVFFAVPNHESWDANHYGTQWAAYDVPRHLSHFSQKTIKELTSKHQLVHIDTIPMKLDAFYVSLLSEQFKSNTLLNLPKALLKGFYSNFKAYKNNNYSSLIYVFQKQ